MAQALVVSVGAHVGLLGLVLVAMRTDAPPTIFAAALALPPLSLAPTEPEGLPEESEDSMEATLVEEPPPAPDLDKPDLQADSASKAETNTAASVGSSPLLQTASADRGADRGQQTPVAWRRDQSSLRARLSDGASVYQPAHDRTAARASSRQAIRAETVTGIGDSTRTRQPRATDPLPALADVTPPPVTDEEAVVGAPAAEQVRPESQADGALRGEGPLDATRGPRSFDVAREGPARDVVATRAASNESHPDLIDLSMPASPGIGSAGRGNGEAPGAVARPISGVAPAATGVAIPSAAPGVTAVSAAERLYARQNLEIRRKVASLLRYPKKLALMLEQGETIIRFSVRQDGRVSGAVQVLKSAGFEEFDQEAVGVVERAAPFPPMGQAMVVTMPITFENPVIR